jgi:hypothetical protein
MVSIHAFFIGIFEGGNSIRASETQDINRLFESQTLV